MSNKSKKVKNQKQKSKIALTPEERVKRTKKIIIISLCVVLALAILFGAVLGIIAAVRNASYVMKLDRVGIDKGVASFLISIYKYDFMIALLESGVEATEDTEEFWSTKRYTGTYGDLFEYEVTRYLKGVIAANALFDEYATLSEEDEYKIDFAVQEILNRKASGSKKTFNELTSGMGFDFNDFKRGTEMLYKMRVVYTTVFGESGSKMPTAYPDYCKEYYDSNYIRAKILIIRTEDTYELDENGDMIKGDDGKYKIRKLETHEKQERAAYIARLNEYVKNVKENGSEIALNDFNNLIIEIARKYNENVISGVENGYYFAEGSAYTTEFGMQRITDEAFSMEIGDISFYETGAIMAEDEETDTETGFSYACYIYRMEKEEKAYQNPSLEHFFRDFNRLASAALYSRLVDEYAGEVILRDKWEKINPVAIPYNYDFKVNTFGT